MDRRLERKSSFFPARFGFLAAMGMLALTGACVSGSLANGSNQHGSNGSQAGGDAQSPGDGQTPGGNGQLPPGSTAGSGSTGVQAPTALPEEQACTSNSPGPRLMRRLTAGEFAASIADLFGDKSAPVAQVFNDSRVLGFTVDSDTLRVQDLNADQLMTNAEAVANWAVTNDAQLSKLKQLATCSTHDTNCAKLFIKNFGRKAFRTAIPDGDTRVTAYSNLFMAEADFATGVSTVITAMLQSPYFLYRSEIGAKEDQGTYLLTPYEVASSLSYLLTGSTPDDTLLQAADAAASAGDKKTALTKLVTDQSARLLAPSGADPLPAAAQDALMNFMSGWLGLDRLYTNVKDANSLSDAQRADMATETKKFILDIWGASTGNTVGDLFGANYTFMNQNLASYYQVSQPGLSSSFTKVTLSGGRDPGILGQASILIGYSRSDTSSPTQRGHLVRSRILCQDVPMPPAGLDTKFTPNSGLKTTRDQYLQGHAAPDHQPCYGCHKSMDPIGVAFEHYDQFGKYRSSENGVTIDATGTIYGASDGDIEIDGLTGPNGLQPYLAQSEEVKSCLVRYWSYYAFGSASWPQDKCTYDAIRKEAADQSYSLQGVLKAILHSPRFTARVMDQ
jgi:hypothetical protein